MTTAEQPTVYFHAETDPAFDVGCVVIQGPRDYLEDTAAAVGKRFAVFDGLGGEGGGDLAAQAAGARFIDDDMLSLQGQLNECNRAVNATQQSPGRGPCTTAATLGFTGSWCAQVVWSGDARVYRFTPATSELVQLTVDHRYGRHSVSQCLGRHNYRPEQKGLVYQSDDIFVLATDGLFEFVDLAELLAKHADAPAQSIAQELIDAAVAAKTSDNATALVVKVVGPL